MRFIDKDKLLKSFKMIRFFLDEEENPSIELTNEEMNALRRFIEQFSEEECVLCNTDYWLNYYDILTKEWKVDEEDMSPLYSFRIVRKPLIEDNFVENNVSDNDKEVEEVENERC